jgi:hypothetical protein
MLGSVAGGNAGAGAGAGTGAGGGVNGGSGGFDGENMVETGELKFKPASSSAINRLAAASFGATKWSVAASLCAVEWLTASSSATDWSVACSSSSSFVAVDWSNADAVAVTNWSVTSLDDDEAWEAIEWSIISDCETSETIERSTEWDLEGVDGLGLASTGLDPRLEMSVVSNPGIEIAVDKTSTAISGLSSTKSWTELLLLVVSLTKTVKL